MSSVKTSEKIYEPEEVGADFYETITTLFWSIIGLAFLSATLPALFG